MYKERLQTYLQSRKHRPLPPQMPNELRQKPLKLSELSTNLSRFYDTIEATKAEIENLTTGARSMSSDQWNARIVELKSQFDKLSAASQIYQNTNVCNDAKRSVEKRRQKRDRIKKRKLELDATKKCQMQNRALKHQQIDRWLERNAENHRENLRQSENKQRAEHVLAEVKSLKNDAKKLLLTFDALKQLHRIRSRDKTSAASEAAQFNCEMGKLQKLWLDVSMEYETEEKRLRAVLDCSNHWDGWQETLFGGVHDGDDIFSLKKNENGLTKLIAIRWQWDSFAVAHDNPYGSSIPSGWAIPNASQSSTAWKAYLKGECEN